MEATVGGSGGIPLDPSLETGRDEEKNLEYRRLRYMLMQEDEKLEKQRLRHLWIQRMGLRQEQEREEEKIIRIFFQKVRSYNEGKCKGECTNLDNFTRIRDHWDIMYEWIMVLTAFIDKMKHKPSKEMRNKRVKFVIYEATRLREREGAENLAFTIKESGEDYARKVVDFQEGAREEKRRKEKEENERILQSQHELFKDILEERTTVRIDTEAEELQRMKEELAINEQRNEKLTESLRIA